MWLFTGKKENISSVVQTVPGDVANTLKTLGPTEQALIDLAALDFPDVNEMRMFVLDVAPLLGSERLHQVSDYLAKKAMKQHNNRIPGMLAADGIVKPFLAYEFVHYKDQAAQHAQEEGALYSGIPNALVLAGLAATGQSMLPKSLPEIAFFLFKKENLDYSAEENEAATLKSDREESNQQAIYLNAIDRFIIKYFIAELDENRKEQEERLMNDERGGYRGGRKVSVGLAVRDAIVKKEYDRIPDVFKQALVDNNISYDEFFNGGTKKFLSQPLYEVLEAARPESPTPG